MQIHQEEIDYVSVQEPVGDGTQDSTQEQADAFSFDILDATKLVPEELVPVVPVGRMVLVPPRRGRPPTGPRRQPRQRRRQ